MNYPVSISRFDLMVSPGDILVCGCDTFATPTLEHQVLSFSAVRDWSHSNDIDAGTFMLVMEVIPESDLPTALSADIALKVLCPDKDRGSSNILYIVYRKTSVFADYLRKL